MGAVWSEDEVAWLRECLAAGDTYAEIAEMSGRTPEDVSAFCTTIPEAIRRPKKHMCPPLRGFVGSIRIDELSERYLRGETMAAIGVVAGVSRQRIDQVVTVLDLKAKRQPTPPGWLAGLPVPQGYGSKIERPCRPRVHDRPHEHRPLILPLVRLLPGFLANTLLRQAIGDFAAVA